MLRTVAAAAATVAVSATAMAAAPPKPFLCNGSYRSHDCTATFWLNQCHHTIKIHWPPLRIPGTTDWARTHRNWCDVASDGEEAFEERKLPPGKCDALVKLMSAAFEGFPEVPWQDANGCGHLAGPDGLLYVTQRSETPSVKDPDPVAARLEDVRACTLHITGKGKLRKRSLRCPVLPQRIFSWLKKFAATQDIFVEIQNPER